MCISNLWNKLNGKVKCKTCGRWLDADKVRYKNKTQCNSCYWQEYKTRDKKKKNAKMSKLRGKGR